MHLSRTTGLLMALLGCKCMTIRAPSTELHLSPCPEPLRLADAKEAMPKLVFTSRGSSGN